MSEVPVRSPEFSILLRVGSALLLARLRCKPRPCRSTTTTGARPALRKCDEPLHHGQVDEARSCFQALMRSTRDPLIQAESAWALGDLRGANELFRAGGGCQRQRRAAARALGPHVPGCRPDRRRDAAVPGGAADRPARCGRAPGHGARHGRAVQWRCQRTRFPNCLQPNDSLVEAHLLAARVAIEDGQLDDAEQGRRSARWRWRSNNAGRRWKRRRCWPPST